MDYNIKQSLPEKTTIAGFCISINSNVDDNKKVSKEAIGKFFHPFGNKLIT